MIDLDAIAPAKGDKFSPNLHTWLKARDRRLIVAEGDVYTIAHRPAPFYIGRIEDGDLIGAPLFGVMARPRTRVGCYVWGGPPTKVPWLLERYYEFGRCAVDPRHEIAFQSREGRWTEEGDRRTCKWCGLVQFREAYTVQKQRWVASWAREGAA